MSIPIIYENNDFLAVNKPAGILTHGVKDIDESSVASFLVEKYPEMRKVGDKPDLRPGVVHRLDRDTSGILILARTQDFFEHIKRLFKNRKIKKTYLALVFGKVDKDGDVDRDIGLKPNTTRWTTWVKKSNAKMVKNALTLYKPIKTIEKDEEIYTLVKLFPETGRTHQLRVHMEFIGKPIVGDRMYGPGENPWGLKRQFLHAQSIEFTGLEGEKFKFEAPLPDDIRSIIDSVDKK